MLELTLRLVPVLRAELEPTALAPLWPAALGVRVMGQLGGERVRQALGRVEPQQQSPTRRSQSFSAGAAGAVEAQLPLLVATVAMEFWAVGEAAAARPTARVFPVALEAMVDQVTSA